MFNTSSVRNIYSPEVTVAKELMVDQVANAMRQDPYQLRRSLVRDARMLAVLDTAAKAANWGKRMAPQTAQGLGIHHEYKGYAACVAEIDCTPQTVNRTVENGYTGPRVTKVTYAVDVGLPINPLGLEAQMIGGIMDGIAQALTYSLHLQDGYFLEGQLGQRLLHAGVELPSEQFTLGRGPGDHHAAEPERAGRCWRVRRGGVDGGGGERVRTRDRDDADQLPDQSEPTPRVHPTANRPADTGVAHRRIAGGILMATYTFILNGQQVSVDCAGDLRLLWALRDLLGVHGPKYGCGLDVCKACTCHINGKAFSPCSVPVSDIQPTDQITTIEGLPATVGQQLHPMQQAWLKYDVGQCGYCQPGQIMAAVALVDEIKADGRQITDADIDSLRNICRCGTYPRIREAIVEAAANM